MIGILAIIVYIILWIIKLSDESRENQHRKDQSQNPFVWKDSKGRTHLKENGQIVDSFRAPWNQHIYIRDKKGNFMFDATEELAKHKAKEQQGAKTEYTTMQLAGNTIKRYVMKKRNGDMGYYTLIYFRGADLIVNLDTMKIERPTDEQLRFELNCKSRGLLHYTEEGFRDMIRDFNLKDRIDRESIIAQNNYYMHDGSRSYWNNSLYIDRQPLKHWSYFDRKRIEYKGDKGRSWIR